MPAGEGGWLWAGAPQGLLVKRVVVAVDFLLCVVSDGVQGGPTAHHLQHVSARGREAHGSAGGPESCVPLHRCLDKAGGHLTCPESCRSLPSPNLGSRRRGTRLGGEGFQAEGEEISLAGTVKCGKRGGNREVASDSGKEKTLVRPGHEGRKARAVGAEEEGRIGVGKSGGKGKVMEGEKGKTERRRGHRGKDRDDRREERRGTLDRRKQEGKGQGQGGGRRRWGLEDRDYAGEGRDSHCHGRESRASPGPPARSRSSAYSPRGCS